MRNGSKVAGSASGINVGRRWSGSKVMVVEIWGTVWGVEGASILGKCIGFVVIMSAQVAAENPDVKG